MDIASALGKPLAWSYQGKVYQVAERTLDFMALWKRHLEEEELAGLRRHAKALGGEYAGSLDRWQKGLATHIYEWGSPHSWDHFITPSGYKYALALSIAEGSGITPHEALAVVDAAYDDETPEGRVAWAELKVIQEALNDPNRKGQLQAKKTTATAATPAPQAAPGGN